MSSALDDFQVFLKDLKGVAGWAVGAGATVPFVGYLAGVTPPEPDGIVLITALVQLVSVILVYQFLKSRSRRTVDKAIKRAFMFLVPLFAIYLLAFSVLTYSTSTAGGQNPLRLAKGLVCKTAIANSEIGKDCPLVDNDVLRDASWEAEAIWTTWSIGLIDFLLAFNWIVVFFFLSYLVGSFVVFQRDQSADQ